MSLKTFHLFLVLIGVLTTSAYGTGQLFYSLQNGPSSHTAFAALALAAGVALLLHGIYFYKETEGEPWL